MEETILDKILHELEKLNSTNELIAGLSEKMLSEVREVNENIRFIKKFSELQFALQRIPNLHTTDCPGRVDSWRHIAKNHIIPELERMSDAKP